MALIQNNEIIIDDGAREYKVLNKKREELGIFSFNPTDMDIITRFQEAEGRIDRIADELDAAVTEDEKVNAALAVSRKIKDELSYIINGNSSECFFAKCNPLSMVGGRFYFEAVLDAVASVIKAEYGKEIRAQKNNHQKYTNKYAPKGRK